MSDTLARLREIEMAIDGRLGVAACDTENGRNINFGSTELWPLCSTFKFLLVAAILAKVDRGDERLERAITYKQEDLLDYAPVTKANITQGQMTLYDLCAATICYSDNTAANLLLALVGGPLGLTQYLHSLGDAITTLSRIEPFLNTALPNDSRDTTSPAAIIKDMEMFLLGDVLSLKSRALLAGWLVNNTTGNERLRAGLPSDWRIGDKTGTGDNGTVNDIAIAWPPARKPLLIAAFITGSNASINQLNAAHAEVARVIISDLT